MNHTVASAKTIKVIKVKEKDLLEGLGLDATHELHSAVAEEMLGEGMLTLSIIQRQSEQSM